MFYRVKWIKLFGEEYHESNFVLLGKQENDLPLFGKIKDIMIINGSSALFQVEEYFTVGLNNHLLCHAIVSTHSFKTLIVSHLVDKYPYSAHCCIGDANLYISMLSDVFL